MGRDRDRNRSPVGKRGDFPGRFRFSNDRMFKKDKRRPALLSNSWHNHSRDLELEAENRERQKEKDVRTDSSQEHKSQSGHQEEKRKDKTTSKANHGHFRVEREDGSHYEISKDLLKYTKTEPQLAYSIKVLLDKPGASTAIAEAALAESVTPEKLLKQLKEVKTTPPKPPSTPPNLHPKSKQKSLTPPPKKEEQPKPKKEIADSPPPPPSKPRISINIDLSELQLPVDVLFDSKPEPEEESIFDIFGEIPVKQTPPSTKQKQPLIVSKSPPRKLEIPNSSLTQIASLYDDDEDESEFMPTNVLRIGSNQIKPAKSDGVFKERKPKKEEVQQETGTTTAAPVISFATPSVVPEEKYKPPVVVAPEIQPLDILKTLDSQSTEVDDFLLQIQEQRLKMEEKLSNTPKKAAPKFMSIIDIDSVQKEINDKLKEIPDHDFANALPPPPSVIPREASVSSSSESSSSSSSSSDSSSSDDEGEPENDSQSESSESSSESSSSSDSSESDDNSDIESAEEKFSNGVSKPVNPIGIDLALTSRSPVMLKIQTTKPKVIPIMANLGDEEQQKQQHQQQEQQQRQPHQQEESSSHQSQRMYRIKDEVNADSKREMKHMRESKRRSREERDHDRSRYDRRSPRKSSTSRRRSLNRRHVDLLVEIREERSEVRSRKKEKDRHRRSSKSDGRKLWPRSRSKSISPPPPPPSSSGGGSGRGSRSMGRRDLVSRSRSRSSSIERDDQGRKRSPWRPPIDFWENLNVPTTSWAYNDEQYFSRAYYDESYNYFEQNQINQSCNSYQNTTVPQQDQWPVVGQNHHPLPHHDVPNGGGGPSSPMRGSLDDRINNVLNEVPLVPQQQQQPQSDSAGGYNCGYNADPGYEEYPRQGGGHYYNQYENRATSDHYRQTANLLSINCVDGYAAANNNNHSHSQQRHNTHNREEMNGPSVPFALQKGNVIEVVPSAVVDSSGYHSEEASRKSSKSAQRKALREKKRMEKKMRKKKLEIELQSLLDGCDALDICLDGEKLPSPNREEVRKVIFSDGVLPGDGTSDSAIDSSDDSNIDLAELTTNQLKKYRKKKRKKKATANVNVEKVVVPTPLTTVVEGETGVSGSGDAVSAPGNGCAPDVNISESLPDLPAPPPPPNEPPVHLVQPSLKREVLERPKKLLYFNTCHRERRMDFFSIFVPFSMFIRLNDPRLIQGHPSIVNRRRIPQPIYPPNMYPPPPQPFQHLPPVKISGIGNTVHHPNEPVAQVTPPNMNTPAMPATPNGPIRHIPTIGDN